MKVYSKICSARFEVPPALSNDQTDNMNETSNMNSGSTGGICSSCLKEIPLNAGSSSSHPLARLCSACMVESLDPQQSCSLFTAPQPVAHPQPPMSSIFPAHFSSLPSSSASSTSSSVSSSNRRMSAFDPFATGSPSHNPLLQLATDFNHAFPPLTLTNFNNDLESSSHNAAQDFMRYFHGFPNGNNHPTVDRDSPLVSTPSNDLSRALAAHQPSTFCCFANNPPYTFCLECDSSLCEKCALTHPKILGFKDHRQQLLTTSGAAHNHHNRSAIEQSSKTGEGLFAGSRSERTTCVLFLVRAPQPAPADFPLPRLSSTTNNDFPSLFGSLFSQLSLSDNGSLLHSPLSSPSTVFCHEHGGYRASHFCDICSRAYCRECQPHHAQHHALSSLQETIENARQLTKQFMRESQTLLYHLDESLKQPTRTIENLSNKSSTIEHEIRTMIKHFLDTLSQRQEFLVKNVDKIQPLKTQALQRQINEINQVIKQLHFTLLGKRTPRRAALHCP